MSELLGNVQLEGALLRYVKWGEGPKILLCFHGFGFDKDTFFRMSSILSQDYTVYSFDLFYHGLSTLPPKKSVLKKKFWKDIIGKFLKENEIKKFSVLGFSMGGKFSLATVEAFPAMIENLILLAPDGIKVSPWYTFATSTFVTRALLKKNIRNPFIYLNLVKIARKLGLAKKSVARFANNQMQTRSQRELVYHTWTAFRKIKFILDELTDTINRQNIVVIIFLGNHDMIMKEEDVKPFIQKISKVKVEVLNAGHSNLIEAAEEFLRANPKYFTENNFKNLPLLSSL